MKLSQDQNEALAEVDPDGIRAIMAVVESRVEVMERDVLSLPLTKDSEVELIYRKARAEGARKLYNMALLALKLK